MSPENQNFEKVESGQQRLETVRGAAESPQVLKQRLQQYRATYQTEVDQQKSALKSFASSLDSASARDFVNQSANKLGGKMMELAQEGEALKLNGIAQKKDKGQELTEAEMNFGTLASLKSSLQSEMATQRGELANLRKLHQLDAEYSRAMKADNQANQRVTVEGLPASIGAKAVLYENLARVIMDLSALPASATYDEDRVALVKQIGIFRASLEQDQQSGQALQTARDKAQADKTNLDAIKKDLTGKKTLTAEQYADFVSRLNQAFSEVGNTENKTQAIFGRNTFLKGLDQVGYNTKYLTPLWDQILTLRGQAEGKRPKDDKADKPAKSAEDLEKDLLLSAQEARQEIGIKREQFKQVQKYLQALKKNKSENLNRGEYQKLQEQLISLQTELEGLQTKYQIDRHATDANPNIKALYGRLQSTDYQPALAAAKALVEANAAREPEIKKFEEKVFNEELEKMLPRLKASWDKTVESQKQYLDSPPTYDSKDPRFEAYVAGEKTLLTNLIACESQAGFVLNRQDSGITDSNKLQFENYINLSREYQSKIQTNRSYRKMQVSIQTAQDQDHKYFVQVGTEKVGRGEHAFDRAIMEERHANFKFNECIRFLDPGDPKYKETNGGKGWEFIKNDLPEDVQNRFATHAATIVTNAREETERETFREKQKIVTENKLFDRSREDLKPHGDDYFAAGKAMAEGDIPGALAAYNRYLKLSEKFTPIDLDKHKHYIDDARRQVEAVGNSAEFYEGMKLMNTGKLDDSLPQFRAYIERIKKLPPEEQKKFTEQLNAATEIMRKINSTKLAMLLDLKKDVTFLSALSTARNVGSARINIPAELKKLQQNSYAISRGEKPPFPPQDIALDPARRDILLPYIPYDQLTEAEKTKINAGQGGLTGPDVKDLNASITALEKRINDGEPVDFEKEMRAIKEKMAANADPAKHPLAATYTNPFSKDKEQRVDVPSARLFDLFDQINSSDPKKRERGFIAIADQFKEEQVGMQYTQKYLSKALAYQYEQWEKDDGDKTQKEVMTKMLADPAIAADVQKGAKEYYRRWAEQQNSKATNPKDKVSLDPPDPFVLQRFQTQIFEQQFRFQYEREVRKKMTNLGMAGPDSALERFNTSLPYENVNSAWYKPWSWSDCNEDNWNQIKDDLVQFAVETIVTLPIGMGAGSIGRSVGSGVLKALVREGLTTEAISLIEKGGIMALRSSSKVWEGVSPALKQAVMASRGKIATAWAAGLVAEGTSMLLMNSIWEGISTGRNPDIFRQLDAGDWKHAGGKLLESIAKAGVFRAFGAAQEGLMAGMGAGAEASVTRNLMANIVGETASGFAGTGLEAITMLAQGQGDKITTEFWVRSIVQNALQSTGTHFAHGGIRKPQFLLDREAARYHAAEAAVDAPRLSTLGISHAEDIQSARLQPNREYAINNRNAPATEIPFSVLPPEIRARIIEKDIEARKVEVKADLISAGVKEPADIASVRDGKIISRDGQTIDIPNIALLPRALRARYAELQLAATGTQKAPKAAKEGPYRTPAEVTPTAPGVEQPGTPKTPDVVTAESSSPNRQPAEASAASPKPTLRPAPELPESHFKPEEVKARIDSLRPDLQLLMDRDSLNRQETGPAEQAAADAKIAERARELGLTPDEFRFRTVSEAELLRGISALDNSERQFYGESKIVKKPVLNEDGSPKLDYNRRPVYEDINLFANYKSKSSAYSRELLLDLNPEQLQAQGGSKIIKLGGDELLVFHAGPDGTVQKLFVDISNMGPTNDTATNIAGGKINLVDIYLHRISEAILVQSKAQQGKLLDPAAFNAEVSRVADSLFNLDLGPDGQPLKTEEARARFENLQKEWNLEGTFEDYLTNVQSMRNLAEYRSDTRFLDSSYDPASGASFEAHIASEIQKISGLKVAELQQLIASNPEAFTAMVNDHLPKSPKIKAKTAEQVMEEIRNIKPDSAKPEDLMMLYALIARADISQIAPDSPLRPLADRLSVSRTEMVGDPPHQRVMKPRLMDAKVVSIEIPPDLAKALAAMAETDPVRAQAILATARKLAEKPLDGLKYKTEPGFAEFRIGDYVEVREGKIHIRDKDGEFSREVTVNENDKKLTNVIDAEDSLKIARSRLESLRQDLLDGKIKKTAFDAEMVKVEAEIGKLEEKLLIDPDTLAFSQAYMDVKPTRMFSFDDGTIDAQYRVWNSAVTELGHSGAINAKYGYAVMDQIMTAYHQELRTGISAMLPPHLQHFKIIRSGGGKFEVVFLDARAVAHLAAQGLNPQSLVAKIAGDSGQAIVNRILEADSAKLAAAKRDAAVRNSQFKYNKGTDMVELGQLSTRAETMVDTSAIARVLKENPNASSRAMLGMALPPTQKPIWETTPRPAPRTDLRTVPDISYDEAVVERKRLLKEYDAAEEANNTAEVTRLDNELEIINARRSLAKSIRDGESAERIASQRKNLQDLLNPPTKEELAWRFAQGKKAAAEQLVAQQERADIDILQTWGEKPVLKFSINPRSNESRAIQRNISRFDVSVRFPEGASGRQVRELVELAKEFFKLYPDARNQVELEVNLSNKQNPLPQDGHFYFLDQSTAKAFARYMDAQLASRGFPPVGDTRLGNVGTGRAVIGAETVTLGGERITHQERVRQAEEETGLVCHNDEACKAKVYKKWKLDPLTNEPVLGDESLDLPVDHSDLPPPTPDEIMPAGMTYQDSVLGTYEGPLNLVPRIQQGSYGAEKRFLDILGGAVERTAARLRNNQFSSLSDVMDVLALARARLGGSGLGNTRDPFGKRRPGVLGTRIVETGPYESFLPEARRLIEERGVNLDDNTDPLIIKALEGTTGLRFLPERVYAVIETIPTTGERVVLNMIVEGQGQTWWVHAPPEGSRKAMAYVETLFQRTQREGISQTDIIKTVAEIQWWTSQATPYERGSSAISDALSKTLLLQHGIRPGRWQVGIMPDIKAFHTSREQFIRDYASYFEQHNTPPTEQVASNPVASPRPESPAPGDPGPSILGTSEGHLNLIPRANQAGGADPRYLRIMGGAVEQTADRMKRGEVPSLREAMEQLADARAQIGGPPDQQGFGVLRDTDPSNPVANLFTAIEADGPYGRYENQARELMRQGGVPMSEIADPRIRDILKRAVVRGGFWPDKFYPVIETIPGTGEKVVLTVLAETAEGNLWWIHTPKDGLPQIMAYAETLYKRTQDPNISRTDLINTVAEIQWWMGHAVPYQRGSAAISDALSKTLLLQHGIRPGRWQVGIMPDIKAFHTPREQFIREYATYFEHSDTAASHPETLGVISAMVDPGALSFGSQVILNDIRAMERYQKSEHAYDPVRDPEYQKLENNKAKEQYLQKKTEEMRLRIISEKTPAETRAKIITLAEQMVGGEVRLEKAKYKVAQILNNDHNLPLDWRERIINNSKAQYRDGETTILILKNIDGQAQDRYLLLSAETIVQREHMFIMPDFEHGNAFRAINKEITAELDKIKAEVNAAITTIKQDQVRLEREQKESARQEKEREKGKTTTEAYPSVEERANRITQRFHKRVIESLKKRPLSINNNYYTRSLREYGRRMRNDPEIKGLPPAERRIVLAERIRQESERIRQEIYDKQKTISEISDVLFAVRKENPALPAEELLKLFQQEAKERGLTLTREENAQIERTIGSFSQKQEAVTRYYQEFQNKPTELFFKVFGFMPTGKVELVNSNFSINFRAHSIEDVQKIHQMLTHEDYSESTAAFHIPNFSRVGELSGLINVVKGWGVREGSERIYIQHEERHALNTILLPDAILWGQLLAVSHDISDIHDLRVVCQRLLPVTLKRAQDEISAYQENGVNQKDLTEALAGEVSNYDYWTHYREGTEERIIKKLVGSKKAEESEQDYLTRQEKVKEEVSTIFEEYRELHKQRVREMVAGAFENRHPVLNVLQTPNLLARAGRRAVPQSENPAGSKPESIVVPPPSRISPEMLNSGFSDTPPTGLPANSDGWITKDGRIFYNTNTLSPLLATGYSLGLSPSGARIKSPRGETLTLGQYRDAIKNTASEGMFRPLLERMIEIKNHEAMHRVTTLVENPSQFFAEPNGTEPLPQGKIRLTDKNGHPLPITAKNVDEFISRVADGTQKITAADRRTLEQAIAANLAKRDIPNFTFARARTVDTRLLATNPREAFRRTDAAAMGISNPPPLSPEAKNYLETAGIKEYLTRNIAKMVEADGFAQFDIKENGGFTVAQKYEALRYLAAERGYDIHFDPTVNRALLLEDGTAPTPKLPKTPPLSPEAQNYLKRSGIEDMLRNHISQTPQDGVALFNLKDSEGFTVAKKYEALRHLASEMGYSIRFDPTNNQASVARRILVESTEPAVLNPAAKPFEQGIRQYLAERSRESLESVVDGILAATPKLAAGVLVKGRLNAPRGEHPASGNEYSDGYYEQMESTHVPLPRPLNPSEVTNAERELSDLYKRYGATNIEGQMHFARTEQGIRPEGMELRKVYLSPPINGAARYLDVLLQLSGQRGIKWHDMKTNFGDIHKTDAAGNIVTQGQNALCVYFTNDAEFNRFIEVAAEAEGQSGVALLQYPKQQMRMYGQALDGKINFGIDLPEAANINNYGTNFDRWRTDLISAAAKVRARGGSREEIRAAIDNKLLELRGITSENYLDLAQNVEARQYLAQPGKREAIETTIIGLTTEGNGRIKINPEPGFTVRGKLEAVRQIAVKMGLNVEFLPNNQIQISRSHRAPSAAEIPAPARVEAVGKAPAVESPKELLLGMREQIISDLRQGRTENLAEYLRKIDSAVEKSLPPEADLQAIQTAIESYIDFRVLMRDFNSNPEVKKLFDLATRKEKQLIMRSGGPEVERAWSILLAENPAFETLRVRQGQVSQNNVLAHTGGVFSRGFGASIDIMPTSREHYLRLMETRPTSVQMVAERLGISREAMTPELLRTFIILHELGHAQDYLSMGQDREKNWVARGKEQSASLPVPNQNPATLLNAIKAGELTGMLQTIRDPETRRLAEKAAQGDQPSIELLVSLQEKAYKATASERIADDFATDFIKRHAAEMGLELKPVSPPQSPEASPTRAPRELLTSGFSDKPPAGLPADSPGWIDTSGQIFYNSRTLSATLAPGHTVIDSATGKGIRIKTPDNRIIGLGEYRQSVRGTPHEGTTRALLDKMTEIKNHESMHRVTTQLKDPAALFAQRNGQNALPEGKVELTDRDGHPLPITAKNVDEFISRVADGTQSIDAVQHSILERAIAKEIPGFTFARVRNVDTRLLASNPKESFRRLEAAAMSPSAAPVDGLISSSIGGQVPGGYIYGLDSSGAVLISDRNPYQLRPGERPRIVGTMRGEDIAKLVRDHYLNRPYKGMYIVAVTNDGQVILAHINPNQPGGRALLANDPRRVEIPLQQLQADFNNQPEQMGKLPPPQIGQNISIINSSGDSIDRNLTFMGYDTQMGEVLIQERLGNQRVTRRFADMNELMRAIEFTAQVERLPQEISLINRDGELEAGWHFRSADPASGNVHLVHDDGREHMLSNFESLQSQIDMAEAQKLQNRQDTPELLRQLPQKFDILTANGLREGLKIGEIDYDHATGRIMTADGRIRMERMPLRDLLTEITRAEQWKQQRLQIQAPAPVDYEQLATGRSWARLERQLPPSEVQRPRQVNMIGDLHGEYQAFHDNAVASGLMNRAGEYTGGSQVFVFHGDILADRGTGSFPILEKLRILREQAKLAGGDIIILAGNHEDMSIAFLSGDKVAGTNNSGFEFCLPGSQGLGVIEFIQKFSSRPGHEKIRSLFEVKALYKTEADPLKAMQQEVLTNMRRSPEGRQILEQMCSFRLVEQINDTLFIHTELTPQIISMLDSEPSVSQAIDNINRTYQQGLRNLLLGEGAMPTDYRRIRDAFLYVYNRDYNSKYQPGDLRSLNRKGINIVVNGHSNSKPENYGNMFPTSDGVTLMGVDHSYGKGGVDPSERYYSVGTIDTQGSLHNAAK